MGPAESSVQEPSKPSAPETFLFTSRVAGYFDPSLSTRRVFLLVQDKHGGDNFLYLVGNYPYSCPLVPSSFPLTLPTFIVLANPWGRQLILLPLLFCWHCAAIWITRLFNFCSIPCQSIDTPGSYLPLLLSLSLSLSVSVCLLPVCGQLKPQRINLWTKRNTHKRLCGRRQSEGS